MSQALHDIVEFLIGRREEFLARIRELEAENATLKKRLAGREVEGIDCMHCGEMVKGRMLDHRCKTWR